MTGVQTCALPIKPETHTAGARKKKTGVVTNHQPVHTASHPPPISRKARIRDRGLTSRNGTRKETFKARMHARTMTESFHVNAVRFVAATSIRKVTTNLHQTMLLGAHVCSFVVLIMSTHGSRPNGHEGNWRKH